MKIKFEIKDVILAIECETCDTNKPNPECEECDGYGFLTTENGAQIMAFVDAMLNARKKI